MQLNKQMTRIDLKTRLSLGVALLVLATTFVIATSALHLVKKHMQASIVDGQFQRLSSIADAIDLKFASRRTLLKTVADGLDELLSNEHPPLQKYLDRYPTLKHSFASVSFLDLKGNVVANLNGPLAPGSVNVADRDYFRETIATGAGVISEPYRSRVSRLAQVAITEPVIDEKGSLRFVLYAAINLADRQFLGELADVKFGTSGYMFILTTKGIIVDLPDKSRILSHVDANGGHNEATTRAIHGFEGTTEGATRAGIPGLYAFKQTREAKWILGVFQPSAEAFSSLNRIETQAWAAAVAFAVLAGLSAMAVIQHQLRPLSALHHRMLKAGGTASPVHTAERDSDEIMELASAFDRLMQHQKETDLQIRTIIDNIPALVSHVDPDLRYTFVNAHIRTLHPESSLVGQSMQTVRGESDFARVRPYFERALAGETVQVERRGDVGRSTYERTYQAHYIPDRGPDGEVRGVFSMSFDITDQIEVRSALVKQEKMLQDIADSIPAFVGYFDRDQRCLFANKWARRFSGIGEAPLHNTTLRSSLGEKLYTEHLQHLAKVLAGLATRFSVETRTGKRLKYFEVHLVPDRDPQGISRGFYAMAFDTTPLKLALLKQERSEKFLRAITDNLPALISYVDHDEQVAFANATYQSWLGLEPAAMVGKHLQMALGTDLYKTRKPMLRRAMAGERAEFEERLPDAGEDRITHSIYLPDKELNGEIRGVFALTMDITERKRVERRLEQLAREDILTGLPNRMALTHLLEQAIARAERTKGLMAVMFLDVDRFKAINDTHGHAVGDAVLIEFAARLKSCVRAIDTVARLGGDEFVIVLENISSESDAADVAMKIVSRVSDPLSIMPDHVLDLTTSIGIAMFESDTTATATELLSRADAALYKAKAMGRDQFMFTTGK